jgi:hypothetical protein
MQGLFRRWKRSTRKTAAAAVQELATWAKLVKDARR